MNKRRFGTFLSLLIIVSSILAACGGGTEAPTKAPSIEAPPTAAPPTEAPPTEEVVPPQETITLEVATNIVGEQAKVLEEIAQEFMQENPNIKVEMSILGQDYENLMRIKMAADDMPDVFSTHGWAKIRYGEFLADLRDEPWADSISIAIRSLVTDEDGKVYVLPMNQDKAGICYNVDILEEYGISVPTTYDELMAAAEKIKTESNGEIIPFHIGGADMWPLGAFYDWMATPLLISHKNDEGPTLLDGTFDWDKFVWLSEQLVEWQEKGYLNKDVLTAKYMDTANAHAEGRVAFVLLGAYINQEALGINPELNVSVMPVPSIVEGDEPTFIGGEWTTWGVWKNSEHIEEAKMFVAFYARPENVARVANSDNMPAGLDGVKTEADEIDYYQKYADLRIFPFFDRYYLPNGMWDVLCKNGQEILAGALTPEQATENMQKEYERLRASQ